MRLRLTSESAQLSDEFICLNSADAKITVIFGFFGVGACIVAFLTSLCLCATYYRLDLGHLPPHEKSFDGRVPLFWQPASSSFQNNHLIATKNRKKYQLPYARESLQTSKMKYFCEIKTKSNSLFCLNPFRLFSDANKSRYNINR